MADKRKFQLAVSPHVGSSQTTRKLMFDVVIALLPALAAAIWYFGMQALLITVLAVVSAVLTEYLCLKFMKKPVDFAFDGSAVVAGLLLAFNLPSSVPWWMPILGSSFAIAVGKQAFGGLGHNIVNPALLGRAFLMASFPVLMTAGWLAPQDWRDGNVLTASAFVSEELSCMTDAEADAITAATPLNVMKQTFDFDSNVETALAKGDTETATEYEEKVVSIRSALSSGTTYLNLFLGRRGGSLGETSGLFLLLGALYLVLRGVLELRLPLSYLGAVALFGWIFGGPGFFNGDPLFQVLAGGVILGGFFMCSDMVTTPVTPKGRIVFGIGAGIITIVIRRWGGYPEGCCYSILLMNLVTPLIDKFTLPKMFGEVKSNV